MISYKKNQINKLPTHTHTRESTLTSRKQKSKPWNLGTTIQTNTHKSHLNLLYSKPFLTHLFFLS